jgi:GNAT superfamily N-acetyltransferase
MPIIRFLTPDDLPRCREIALACLDRIGGVNEAMREVLRERARSDRFSSYLQEIYTVLYEEEGRVLGLGGLDDDEIKRMYTDPAFQGRGVGATIFRALETEAWRQGVRELIVDSYTSAEGFYLKMGFRRVKLDAVILGEARQDFVHMAKRL